MAHAPFAHYSSQPQRESSRKGFRPGGDGSATGAVRSASSMTRCNGSCRLLWGGASVVLAGGVPPSGVAALPKPSGTIGRSGAEGLAALPAMLLEWLSSPLLVSVLLPMRAAGLAAAASSTDAAASLLSESTCAALLAAASGTADRSAAASAAAAAAAVGARPRVGPMRRPRVGGACCSLLATALGCHACCCCCCGRRGAAAAAAASEAAAKGLRYWKTSGRCCSRFGGVAGGGVSGSCSAGASVWGCINTGKDA